MNEIVAKTSINFNETAVLTPNSYTKYNPKPREYYVRDEKVNGFHIRIYPSGTKVYGVHAKRGGVGRKVQRSLGQCEGADFTSVKKEAKDWLFNMRQKGVDTTSAVVKDAREGRTLLDAVIEFNELDKTLDAKTVDDYKMVIKNRMPSFSKTRITEITKDAIVEWWRKSAGARSDVKAFMYARKIMEKCRASDFISENPFHDAKTIIGEFPSIKQSTTHIPKDRLGDFLSVLISVSKNLHDVARDYIVFLLISGKRKQEVLSLKWNNVDFNNGTITFDNTKFGKVDVIPMTDFSFLLLKNRQKKIDKNNSTWVFNSVTGKGHMSETHKHFAKINKELDLGFTLSAHDLRRTFATLSRELGLNNEDLSILLNHKKQDITEQYVSLSQDYKRENLESVARFINQNSGEALNWIAVNWYGGNSELYVPSEDDNKPKESFEDKMKYLQAEHEDDYVGYGHPEYKPT